MQMGLFSLWTKDRNQFDRPIDRSKPMRRSRVELDGLMALHQMAWFGTTPTATSTRCRPRRDRENIDDAVVDHNSLIFKLSSSTIKQCLHTATT